MLLLRAARCSLPTPGTPTGGAASSTATMSFFATGGAKDGEETGACQEGGAHSTPQRMPHAAVRARAPDHVFARAAAPPPRSASSPPLPRRPRPH